MTISIFLSKNYIHIKDSLFYSEYSIILTFLFIAIMLSVTIANKLFMEKLSEASLLSREKRKARLLQRQHRGMHSVCVRGNVTQSFLNAYA